MAPSTCREWQKRRRGKNQGARKRPGNKGKARQKMAMRAKSIAAGNAEIANGDRARPCARRLCAGE